MARNLYSHKTKTEKDNEENSEENLRLFLKQWLPGLVCHAWDLPPTPTAHDNEGIKQTKNIYKRTS